MADGFTNSDNKTVEASGCLIKSLYLIGEINEEVSKDSIRYLFETNWTDEGIQALNVYINSEGGFLKDCFGIIDAINFVRKACGVTINTYGLGECASAGFFLFIVGDYRILFPNCKVYVHEHIADTIGATYGERKRDEKDQKVLYEMYVTYTANSLGISKTRVKNLLKKNRYLTDKELESYNILAVPDKDEQDSDEHTG